MTWSMEHAGEVPLVRSACTPTGNVLALALTCYAWLVAPAVKLPEADMGLRGLGGPMRWSVRAWDSECCAKGCILTRVQAACQA